MMASVQVVAAVPAGRRRYLSMLLPYLRRQKGLLDRCDLWCNTTDQADIDFIRHTADADPFFRAVAPGIPVQGVASVHHFFRACVEPDTVYVRFDDDVCWVAPDAIEALVRFRLAHPQYALVVANTINNGICSHLHQRLGCLSLEEGFCTYDANGDVGWRSGAFAQFVHETFLSKITAGQAGDYLFPKWIAWQYERISINCISWLGNAFAEFGGEVDVEDEAWLTQIYPARLQRPVAICGSALVAHFAFWTQRDWLEENTGLLERYTALAEAVPV